MLFSTIVLVVVNVFAAQCLTSSSAQRANVTGVVSFRQKRDAAPVAPTGPTAVQSGPVRETGPAFTFAAWDENGKICILAKLDASFTITYDTKFGKQQLIDKLLPDSVSKGRCDSLLDEMPVLDIKWRGGFTFRMIFEKNNEANTWGIQTLDLLYNTADSLFRDAINGAKTVAKSKEGALRQFTTSMDKSYLCPSAPTINLYNAAGEPTAILRMANIQVQAYKIINAKFSPIQHCGQVGFGSGVPAPFYVAGYQQDESVPMIVGSITIFVSIGTVVGYAVYRSFFVKRVDYDTMA